ncbi:hypothetical protein BVAD3_39010 [Bacillus velezensis]|nr:hypothetical protein BVAD3_39010 [Bacillus velezensis]
MVCPTYQCSIQTGTVRNCELNAIIDVGWFSLQNLPDPLTLTTKNALESYLNKFESQRK